MMGRSSDFKFCEEKLPFNRHSCGDDGDFEVLKRVVYQDGAYSPPLWTRAPVDFRQETSTLLQQDNYYCRLSPTSRLRAITDSRRELMEMIKNMPESSYELSLKDIVDHQQDAEDVQEKQVVLIEEKNVKHKRENRIQQRTKDSKSIQIRRSESMENEAFLLKMFLPVSLSSKKKSKVRKNSKISPGQSTKGSEKQASKNWWKIIFLAIKDNKNNMNINQRASDIGSNRISEKKCKSRGCLF